MIHMTRPETSSLLRMPWRNCISVGRGYELLRADLLEHLRFVQQELQFSYCRFHGIFHDDVAVVVPRPDGTVGYQWHQLDKIYDALLEMGLRPFVELNPMPKALASGDQTFFEWKMNVTPPKSYEAWADLVRAFAEHLIDRYGLEEVRQWYFEVWNEPNLSCFWSGTQEEYWQLYDASACTLKAVDSQLRVGGPASSKANWVTDIINHCVEHNIPIDFVSTHLYPQDEYVTYQDRQGSPHEIGQFFIDIVRGVQQEVRTSALPDLEIHWTEWNSMSADSTANVSWIDNPTVDNAFAAPLVVRQCLALDDACDSLCWWTASDIFEESGMPHNPYSCTYGLVNILGIPKASFNAFALLKRMRGEQLALQFTQPAPAGCGVCATQEAAVTRVLLWNQHLLEVEDQPIWEESLRIPVAADRPYVAVTVTIGEGNGSAWETWRALGSPHNVSPIEEQLLRAHATPLYDLERLSVEDGMVELSVALHPNEVRYVEVRPMGQPAMPKGATPDDIGRWNMGMSEQSR